MVTGRESRLLLITLCFLLSLFFSTWSYGGNGFYGKKVGTIDFMVESPFQVSYLELINLISISPGTIITSDKVRASMASLNAKGLFKRISLYGETGEGAVHLLFRLEPSVLISTITVNGTRYFSKKEITSRVRLRRGSSLDNLDSEKIRRAVKNVYRKNGYFSPSVTLKIACRTGDGKGELLMEIDEGPRPYIREIKFSGNTHVKDEELLEIMGVEMGALLNMKTFRKKLSKVLSEYKKRGYIFATIGEPVLEEVRKGVSLNISITEGRKVLFTFKGNRQFRSGKLRKVAGLLGMEMIPETDVLEYVRGHLTGFYEEEGYPFAKVEVSRKGEDRILVNISEGGKGYIHSIRFKGNDHIEADELEGVMETSSRKLFSLITGSGIYHAKTFAEDFERIRGYYQSKGYPNALVTLDSVKRGEEGSVIVTIAIVEGDRFTVKEVKWKGVTFFTDTEIEKVVRNVAGVPINYVSAFADGRLIQKLYLDKGFDDCKVAVKFRTNKSDRIIFLSYIVDEGQRFYLGKTVVTGTNDVSSDVVLRELPVKRGEPLGESDLIEFQQRLYRTGLFSGVKIKKFKNDDQGTLNLFVNVKEANSLVLKGGLGYGTRTGYRVSLGGTHKNIDSFGRSVGVTLSISEIEDVFTSELKEPWLFGVNMVGGLAFTAQSTKDPSDSFVVDKVSVTGSLTKEFWERSSFAFQLELERSNTKEVKPGSLLTSEDIGLKNNIILRPILILDLRDDPFITRKGSYNSLVGELGPGFLGSDVNYWKLNGQKSSYFPLKKELVFALSARGGYARSLEHGEVPIEKRFFIGGRTTVRGFRENRLGPLGIDGSPVGGDTMVILNGELRYFINNAFVVGPFVDAGSVWLRNVEGFGFDLRETAGVSFKYLTPAGPISFDVGFKLDKKSEESLTEYHFTIGAAF